MQYFTISPETHLGVRCVSGASQVRLRCALEASGLSPSVIDRLKRGAFALLPARVALKPDPEADKF